MADILIKNSSKVQLFWNMQAFWAKKGGFFMERTILHLDLDTFFVSVERLINPSLDGKPVIVGGMSDRGVVSTCSYEARRFGVHSAMPMRTARQLCSQAVFIRGDMELYSRYSRLVTDIIADSAPVYEKMSIDEHYLDLTGMDRFNLRAALERRQQDWRNLAVAERVFYHLDLRETFQNFLSNSIIRSKHHR